MIQWLCRGATALELCLGFVIPGCWAWILNLSQTFTFSGKKGDIFTKKLESTSLHKMPHVPWPPTIKHIPFCLICTIILLWFALLMSVLEKATYALLCVCVGFGRSRPIFGYCQSTSHSTYSTACLSLLSVTETLKQVERLNLFLRPPQFSAAPRWTGYPVQLLESIALPSRSCWNVCRDMSMHEWFKIWVKYDSRYFQSSPIWRKVWPKSEETL